MRRSWKAAHVVADGLVVVVDDDDEIAFQLPGVVEGFEGQAAGHGSVADHADHRVVLSGQRSGLRKAEAGGDRGGAVARVEYVAAAFGALGEAAHAAVAAQRIETVLPAGQEFMRIALMAHIKDQFVVRGVEHDMQRHGQFHNA